MVSRSKTALVAVSTIALVGLFAGCAGPAESTDGDADAPVSITYVGYGGDGQDAQIEAWQTSYTAENPNVTFVNTSPPDVAQVKAQVEAGSVQWDVMAIAPYAAEQNCGTLFEHLDLSSIDQTNLVPGSVGDCYVANWINTTPLAYRTDAYPEGEGPTTIADFFDTDKFPGPRGVVTNLQNGILEYPLIADGVKPDEIYPLDVDRALEKWDSIREVTTFAPNVGALQQAVAADQVDMFFLPDSRIVPMLAGGDEITVVWDVAVASINAFAVPLGSTKKEAVEDFVSSVVEPGPVAKISELLGVAPINSEAKPKLDEFAQQVAVFDPEVNPGETVIQDVPWYAENFNETTIKLTDWLAG